MCGFQIHSVTSDYTDSILGGTTVEWMSIGERELKDKGLNMLAASAGGGKDGGTSALVSLLREFPEEKVSEIYQKKKKKSLKRCYFYYMLHINK